MLPASTDDLAQRLAVRVRETRIERRISLSKLAGRAGLGKATLAAVEGGQSNPTLGTVAALAEALGIEPCELICDVRDHHELLGAHG